MKSPADTQNGSGLCREFIETAKAVLSKCPSINHSWVVAANGGNCSLSIPKQDESGFDITVEVSPDEVVVFALGAHQHFDIPENSNSEKVSASLGLIRDLLSPHMRIRELRAGKSAYRWIMEVFHHNKWQTECSTGLFFWNYFARRNEIVFQNKALLGRPSDT